MSEGVGGKAALHVYKQPRSGLYLVAAYFPGTANLAEAFENANRLERSKILRIEKFVAKEGTLVLALKERCEFYGLIENYGIHILTPYVMDGGCRIFCVYGNSEDLEKYIDNLEAYYGKNCVSVKKMSIFECLRSQMRDNIALFVLSTLTEREREVLLRAYRLGYLSPRRKTSLRELSLEVGLAKPTTSIMVGKALRKLVQRVFETAT